MRRFPVSVTTEFLEYFVVYIKNESVLIQIFMTKQLLKSTLVKKEREQVKTK